MRLPLKPVREKIITREWGEVFINTEHDILIDPVTLKYLHYMPGDTAKQARAIIYTLMEGYDGKFRYKEVRDGAFLKVIIDKFFDGRVDLADSKFEGISQKFVQDLKSLELVKVDSG